MRALMEQTHKTQASLAAAAHCSRPSIGHYINGDSIPSADILMVLSEELGCSVDYLVGRTNAKTPDRAPAVDELGLTETVVEELLRRKDTAGKAYHLAATLLTVPWFWDVMHAAQLLIDLKQTVETESGEDVFPGGFDIKHIDGKRVVCYSGDAVRRSLIHYMAENFAEGLDTLTDALTDTAQNKNTAPANEPKR